MKRAFAILALVGLVAIIGLLCWLTVPASGHLITNTTVATNLNVAGVAPIYKPAQKASICMSGTQRPDDGDVININGRIYEVDKDANYPESSGVVKIDCNAAGDLAGDMEALELAIESDGSAIVDIINGNDVVGGPFPFFLFVAKTAGVAGNAYTITTDWNMTGGLHNGTFVGGADAANVQMFNINHTLSATDASVRDIFVPIPFTTVLNWTYQLYDENGNLQPGDDDDDFDTIGIQNDGTNYYWVANNGSCAKAWAQNYVIKAVVFGY